MPVFFATDGVAFLFTLEVLDLFAMRALSVKMHNC